MDAWDKAFATDNVSPFGGIVCVNREVDLEFANTIHSIFTEVIIAPSFAPDALERLQKKRDRRLVVVDFKKLAYEIGMEIRTVAGGFLVQRMDAPLLS